MVMHPLNYNSVTPEGLEPDPLIKSQRFTNLSYGVALLWRCKDIAFIFHISTQK